MMDLNEDQQRRKDLILRNLQEILGEDKLSKQLSSGKNIHVYWGTATTGRPHVGYFVPMQKIADFLRADIRVTILFADLHAFLDNMKSSFELLHNRVLYYEYVVKALMKALDVPIEKLHFVRGRSYQLKEAYTKDLLRLCGMVSLRDAIRAGAEVVKQVDNPLLSGILYPLLQAIDEQHLKVDGQFGGVDQRKIFIFAEEQLPKIKLGKRFHLMNPMVPGLTGSKMSSSEENTKIDLLDTPLSVSAKIGSARCPKTTESDDNGVLAFFKHVVVPIQGQHNQIALNNHIFADFDAIRSAFDREEIREQDLKEYLTNFLNQILSKVQEHCHQQPEFVNIVSKAYPTATTSEKIEEINREKEIESQNVITFEGPFGYSMELFPSRKVHSQDLLYFDVSGHKILPLRVLWRCSPKGRLTLGHLSALLQLKYLSTMGHQITILVSDLDAFLDRNKCPWTEMKNRSEQYIKALKDILRALNMENVVLQYSNDYEYDENFTMEMYQFASVVTRDETAPTSDGTTTPFLGSHLCPIYFALDIKRANPDLVLLGSNQRENAKLLTRIYKRLNIEVPAFLLHPELVGTDGQKMSATRPEFHLDLMQDGIKKVRQKIGKSFCEPGNAQDNVALKLCRDFLFPFHQLQWKKSKNNDDECEELSMVIERKPGNGGDLAICNYEEIESKFSTQQLHPADLKAFVCNQIFEIFDTLRNGQVLMS